MKYLIFLILLFQFISSEIIAQTKSDSLYAKKIDSLIEISHNKDFWKTDIIQKQIEDSTENKTVIGIIKNGILIDIYYQSHFGECESTTFHLVEKSLVLVEYRLADPDVRSDQPPTTTYRIYFKNNQVVMQSSSSYAGGPKFCDSYSVNKKDFIKELDYFTHLITKN